jgi:hypothetical protein
MQVHKEDDPTSIIVHQGLDSKYRGLLVRLSTIIESVEVVPLSIHSIGSMKDSVRVKNRND